MELQMHIMNMRFALTVSGYLYFDIVYAITHIPLVIFLRRSICDLVFKMNLTCHIDDLNHD